MKQYRLKVLTGSPGDMENNIDWEKYKNAKSEYVDMILNIEDDFMLDKYKKGSVTESYKLIFLKVGDGK